MTVFNLNRRGFILSAAALVACDKRPVKTDAPKNIAITIDDFHLSFDVKLNPRERNERILEAFDKYSHKAAGFVTGRFVDNPFGDEVVQSWSDAGHLIGNHTYSHLNSTDEPFETITADIIKNDVLLQKYAGYEKIFRFPFLAEGGTLEKIDRYREFLKQEGYRYGPVSTQSIDWYTTSRLETRLKGKADTDLVGYRDYYVKTVIDIAEHFHGLAARIGFADMPHNLLVHHNILNGLFLGDVMQALKDQGWEFMDARKVFDHPVYKSEPRLPNAGRSLVAVLAQERGLKDIAFPEAYHGFGKKTMDALGL